MNRFNAIAANMLGCLAVCLPTTGALGQADDWAQDARTISVVVRVEDEAGAPISSAPVQVYTRNGLAFGMTNAGGDVTIFVGASPTEDAIAIARIWDGRWHADLTPAEKTLARTRHAELVEEYAFKAGYPAAIDVPGDQFSMTIVGFDGVRVSGRFVDDAGQPVTKAGGSAFPYGSTFEADENGGFEVTVRKGANTELIYLNADSHQMYVIELDDTQTAADVDLGNIVLNPSVEDAELAISLSPTNTIILDDETLVELKTRVVLVREDGSTLLSYRTNKAQTAAVNASWDVREPDPRLPGGTYYVAPGPYGIDVTRALRLAVLAGRQAALDAAGVPKVTVPPGGEAAVSVDAEAARDAILQVGADLLND